MMQKLKNGDVLNLPIDIFLFRRQFVWFIIGMLMVSFLTIHWLLNMLNGFLFFVMTTFVLLVTAVTLYGIKFYFSPKPIVTLQSDKLIIWGLQRSNPQSIPWQSIRDFKVYSSQHGSGLVLYLKNRPPFEDTINVSLYSGSVIQGKLLNTREVESIFKQFINHYQQQPNEHLIIRYQKMTKHFLDWA